MPDYGGYSIGQKVTWNGDPAMVDDGYFPTGTGAITLLTDMILQVTWDAIPGNPISGGAISTFTYDDPGLSALTISPVAGD